MARIWNKHKLNTPLKRKVFVAMSGGVDSSVAAALLAKQGYDVTGVFFKPWAPPTTNCQQPTANFCQWETDRQDAMRVCAKLRISFKTWDFSREYGQHIAQYMIRGYQEGITPNPDVMCNKEIKFGLFLKKALAEGADYIATGHYVRRGFRVQGSGFRKKSMDTGRWTLCTGIDSNKDQSYFLWMLTQAQLKHCLFPVGDYAKPQIRTLAKKFGLPNHNKKDSQGVCFVGQLNMKDFLKKYIKPKIGDIVSDKTGETVGQHDGVHYYTIGQRHGLNIKNGQGPYFVVNKNLSKNIIYVAKEGEKNRLSRSCSVKNINWITDKPGFPLACTVKIRYRSQSIPAIVPSSNLGTGKLTGGLTIRFKKPAMALTPGQSAVFYHGQEVIGGGIII